MAGTLVFVALVILALSTAALLALLVVSWIHTGFRERVFDFVIPKHPDWDGWFKYVFSVVVVMVSASLVWLAYEIYCARDEPRVVAVNDPIATPAREEAATTTPPVHRRDGVHTAGATTGGRVATEQRAAPPIDANAIKCEGPVAIDASSTVSQPPSDVPLTSLPTKSHSGVVLSEEAGKRQPIAGATITVGQISAVSDQDGSWQLRFLRQPERDSIVRVEHKHHLSNFLRFEDLLANNKITLAPKYRLIVLERGDRSDVLVRTIRKAIAVRLAGCQAVTLLAEQEREQLVGLLEKYQKGRGLYDKATVAEAGRFLGATHVVLVSIVTDAGPKTTAECSMIELATIETKVATAGVLESEEQTESLGERLADEVLVALSKVRILTPLDNTEVPAQTSIIKVGGGAVGLPRAWGLQLSVLTPGNPRHFFQRGMTVETGGDWVCTDAYIGRDIGNTSETEFVIYAVLLDSKANAVVQAYLKEIEADPDGNKGVDLKSLSVGQHRLLNSVRVRRPAQSSTRADLLE